MFNLSTFIESNCQNLNIYCEKLSPVSICRGPSSRWGHSAAVYQNKIYILGGRNSNDISDLHCLDVDCLTWTQIPLKEPQPKPRRRHSSVFIASSLLMFGGFDGTFYNDLHILHTNKTAKESITVSPSTLIHNLAAVVNDPEVSNIEFVLKASSQASQQVVYANKSLVLYRLVERELRTTDFNSGNTVFRMQLPELLGSTNSKTQQLFTSQQARFQCSSFLQRVYRAQAGDKVMLPEINESQRSEFLAFLEFCHCEKLVHPMTCLKMRQLRDVCT